MGIRHLWRAASDHPISSAVIAGLILAGVFFVINEAGGIVTVMRGESHRTAVIGFTENKLDEEFDATKALDGQCKPLEARYRVDMLGCWVDKGGPQEFLPVCLEMLVHIPGTYALCPGDPTDRGDDVIVRLQNTADLTQ